MPTRIDTGIPEIDAKLANLARKDANKIARAGIRAGLGSLAKSLRGAIRSHSCSGEMKTALLKTVGQRFVTSGRKAALGPQAKVGLGVGSGRTRGISGTKDRRGRRGVGLSGNNVHWAALGTAKRWTGSRGLKMLSRLTGNPRRYTGSMPQIDVVREAGKNGISSLRSIVEAKCRDKIEDLVK